MFLFIDSCDLDHHTLLCQILKPVYLLALNTAFFTPMNYQLIIPLKYMLYKWYDAAIF